MLYTRIRFVLIFLFLGLGILLHVQLGWRSAWYLYAGAALLLITYFAFGPVWLAFRMLSRGYTEEADRLLRSVRRPDWLIRRNRAYYYFTKGLLHLQRKELGEGEAGLQQSLDLGLSRDKDAALAHLNLAHIAFVQQRYEEARRRLEATRAVPTDDLMLKEKVKEMEAALARLS